MFSAELPKKPVIFPRKRIVLKSEILQPISPWIAPTDLQLVFHIETPEASDMFFAPFFITEVSQFITEVSQVDQINLGSRKNIIGMDFGKPT